MGYFYEVLERFQEVHSSKNPLGLRMPDWSKLGPLLWGERRGLVRFAPVVLLTIPGLVALVARRSWDVAIVSASTIAAVLLMNLSYPEWTGGWSTGPRLLVPLLPFAMLPVAGLLAVGGRRVAWVVAILTVLGWGIVLAFESVGGRIPDAIGRPLVDGVWPLIRGDVPLPGWTYGNRYARNLVTIAIPDALKLLPRWAGWLTILPLVLFQGAMIGAMLRAIRPREPSASS
jgi:hypothetical protein